MSRRTKGFELRTKDIEAALGRPLRQTDESLTPEENEKIRELFEIYLQTGRYGDVSVASDGATEYRFSRAVKETRIVDEGAPFQS